jgi:hypothetical protein
MSDEPVLDIPREIDPPPAEPLLGTATDAPGGRELFPVMAVLLAQVLDLDLATKESSR